MDRWKDSRIDRVGYIVECMDRWMDGYINGKMVG